jgi:hypothetical protein
MGFDLCRRKGMKKLSRSVPIYWKIPLSPTGELGDIAQCRSEQKFERKRKI